MQSYVKAFCEQTVAGGGCRQIYFTDFSSFLIKIDLDSSKKIWLLMAWDFLCFCLLLISSECLVEYGKV